MEPKKPEDTEQFPGTVPGTVVEIDKFGPGVFVESTPNDSNKDGKPDGTIYFGPKPEVNYFYLCFRVLFVYFKTFFCV